VEVRIGIKNAGRELAFESDQAASEVEAIVSSALASGAKLVSFTDNKGRKFLVPTPTLAYLEIGADQSRRVGFIA
jgi:hypothetical protein